MEQNKFYGQYELSEEDLQAVTGGASDLNNASTGGASGLNDNVKYDMITAQLAMKSLEIDLQNNDREDAQKDLKIWKKALHRVQHDMK